MSKNLLGVDFGTTSLKACLFDDTGKKLAETSKAYKLVTRGEFIEFDAEEFFRVLKSAVDEITANFEVDAMAIDTQGETLIVLGADGKPLMNAIIWLDNRAKSQAARLEAHFGAERVYSMTGQAETPAGYPAPKIMWIKENMPEIFSMADKFLLLEDYMIYRLTGRFASSRSLYSSSLLMDINSGEYIPEVLSFVGISESQLPKLFESGTVVGEYEGISVCTSALDQIAGATGAGVTKKGIVSETTGTALAVCSVTDELPAYDPKSKVSAYYVRKGLYCLLNYAPTAGATLEWFKSVFCPDLSYPEMDKIVEETPAGAEGLICLPHLCGTVMPENIPSAKGAFFGMEMKHNRSHFLRAIYESVAYTIKEFFDYMGIETEEIRSVGGGAKSRIWCEIKAAVLGKRTATLCERETAALGSALFAGVGAGVFADVESAAESIVHVKETFLPKSGYEELYSGYKSKEKAILDIYKR